MGKQSMTNEEYKSLCKKLHGDKYSLDKVVYKGMREHITATCPIHGDFSLVAYDFAHLRGCPSCGRANKKIVKKETNRQKRHLTTESFIEEARKVHGDKYDYSKVEYVNNKTKVCIICPVHGEFWQVPSSHLKGCGCEKCGKEQGGIKQSYTLESFIEKAKEIHGNKYDYSKVDYKGCNKKICIICPEHGEFWQMPYSHLQGHGCPKCMSEKNAILMMSNTEDFINKSQKIHGENNDYSNVIYRGAKIPVQITCEKGHTYWQMPNKHLSGHGCPLCTHNISKAENEISDFIKSVYDGTIINNTRKQLKDNIEIDIFLPEKNLAFEYDGLYWHNETRKDKNFHLKKTEEALNNGTKLIHIFEDEWMYKQDIVKSRILNLLGKTPSTIYARKCEIKIVDTITASNFLDENHLQGKLNSSIRIGLYYNNELVSLMTFGKQRKNLGSHHIDGYYELLRFCNKLNTNVVGAASKMLKFFIREFKPKHIISYADRRWSNGNVYEKMGFTLTHKSEPNYFYIIGQKRYNRFLFRKNELIKQGFDKNKSEHQIMAERGIYRIYDCGCLCYEKDL